MRILADYGSQVIAGTTIAMRIMMFTMMPMMAWISYFFAGFLLAKVPFSLTQKFRGMTQSGIDI